MDMIGGNPQDALKKIGEELQEKFKECGMGKVEEFVDQLDDIKAKCANGPGELMDMFKAKIEEMKKKIEDALANPGSLVPGGLATCADFYGKSVAGKLGEVKTATEGVVEDVMQLASGITEPMKKLAQTLEDVMAKLDATLKQLAKLPGQVTQLGNDVSGPDDIAKIDTEPMNKCLDVSGITGPLDELAGSKDILGGAYDGAVAQLGKIDDYIGKAPGMIKSAFDIPAPLCFLQGALMSQAPQLMKDLLALVDKMKEVNMQSLLDMLKKVMDVLGNLNPAAIKEPVEKFAADAKSQVGKLDKVVSAAKMASGGGMGGAIGKLGKMF